MKKSILLLSFIIAALSFQAQAFSDTDTKTTDRAKREVSNNDDAPARLQAALEHFNADLTVIQVRFKHDPIKEANLSQKAYQEYQEKVKSIIGAEQVEAFQANR